LSEEKTKPKILYMTDYSTRSGFGLVADNVCKGLSEKFDVFLLGWGFHFQEPIGRNGYTLLPSGQHPFGADILPYYLERLKPEVLITQADTRMIDYLPDLLNQMPTKPTWIYYPVIDGHVWDLENKRTKWPSNWTAVMKQADVVVGMTKFGQKILKANGLEDARHIDHGVDTSVFKPFPKKVKEEIKQSVGLGGKFVVGGIFKNIQRKNPEKYLHSYAIFRKRKENKTVLLLHTQPNQKSGGQIDLVQQAIDIGLVPGKDVVFSSRGVPTSQMPAVYNSMDVFWTLGGMESFCIPLVEAMSCGVPVVALQATTFPEILGKTGLLTKVPTYPGSKGVPFTYGSYNGVECMVPNPYDVAKKTNSLYADKFLRERIAINESERAVKFYDWSLIRKQWVELVKSCVITEDDLPEEWQKIYEQTK